MSENPVLKVAVPIPLFGLFDYLAPTGSNITTGCRVRIPFGRHSKIGIVMEQHSHSELPTQKLKTVKDIIDDQPILPPDLLKLLKWAADYYQYPLGEVISSALPGLLREGKAINTEGETQWQLTEAGRQTEPDSITRAPKQAGLLKLIQQSGDQIRAEDLNRVMDNWRPAIQALEKKQLVQQQQRPCLETSCGQPQPAPELNEEQQQAVDAVSARFNQFQSFLLQGVTGSGKTEVYLALVEQMILRHQQVLILVPEISLTPQLTHRFQQRLSVPVAALHSGLNDRQRLCAWGMAAQNKAPVVIGTRSALFTPMPELGLIIIDEEHDNSLKQTEGFRYHARDLAMVRARNRNIPVLLGSATPSLESLNNVDKGNYQLLELNHRAVADKPPAIHLLDVRRRPMTDGLSDIMLEHIQKHLQQQGQVLLFLNRRGYAPLLMCHECGWNTECPRCDAHMTLHQHSRRLQCHHCGHERAAPTTCPQCGCEELYIPGAGTERIEQALQQHFPDIEISRIDRDTTRRKGSLDQKLQQARSGQSRILIGTQMLAKGHDFPNVTLVGILDTDQGLFSSDFRGTEQMAQLIIQVAGRAGRAEKPGEVLIQTHHPEHPLLHQLLVEGYRGFARAALDERQMAGFPPYSHMTVLRAEASHKQTSFDFLKDAYAMGQSLQHEGIDWFGPLPAPMEKRAGRYRAQLILQSGQRGQLQQLLRHWVLKLPQLKSASRVRWSVDVDPQDMY